MDMDNFSEYYKLNEPDKREKSVIWQAAVGLQKVDGLTPSAYLIQAAKENIEGTLPMYDVKERLVEYYNTQPAQTQDRTEEADKVSANIAEILGEQAFVFSPVEYITIHRRLFEGVADRFAGKIRDYNISKAEWVLNGETVLYASTNSIMATLDYDFNNEKKFNYNGLSKQDVIEHIARFIADIWQIHPFGEGNTRATAVFAIKYLRSFGFAAQNDLFAENSWYFRNALVRANYNNVNLGVFATMEYLNRFFDNLLGAEHVLKNRELLIN